MSILTPDGSHICLDGPASLPIVVPHLLGFHPVRSLVVIGLVGEQSTVRVTCRVDMPDESLSHWHWESLVRALDRGECSDAIVVAYPAAGTSLTQMPAVPIVESIVGELAASGIRVGDAIAISGLRYRSYFCVNDGCCPEDGREPTARQVLELKAALVWQGSAPRASRDDIAAALVPRGADDPLRCALTERRGGIEMRLPSGVLTRATGLVDALGCAAEISMSARVRLMVYAAFVCSDVLTRDLFLFQLTRIPRSETLAHARDILSEVVRCYDGHERAAAAACLAVCAWVCGDGAAARVAADVALEVDPSYRLAVLVSVALDDGQPPSLWTDLMGHLSVEQLMGPSRVSVDI